MSLPENRTPTHPGEILLEEFLVPMRISQAALSRHLGIPVQRVNEIVRGRARRYPRHSLAAGSGIQYHAGILDEVADQLRSCAFQAYEEDREIGRLIAYRIIYRFIPCHLSPHSQAGFPARHLVVLHSYLFVSCCRFRRRPGAIRPPLKKLRNAKVKLADKSQRTIQDPADQNRKYNISRQPVVIA